MRIGNMNIPPDRGRQYTYWRNILVGLDQFAGTLWGISCDETISSWIGRNDPDGWIAKIINWLFKDKNHCRNSIGN
jgi:hypothetical protein